MLDVYLANCLIEHGCCLKIHSFNLLQSLKQVSTPLTPESQINVWMPPSGCMLKVICVLVEIQVFGAQRGVQCCKKLLVIKSS